MKEKELADKIRERIAREDFLKCIEYPQLPFFIPIRPIFNLTDKEIIKKYATSEETGKCVSCNKL